MILASVKERKGVRTVSEYTDGRDMSTHLHHPAMNSSTYNLYFITNILKYILSLIE